MNNSWIGLLMLSEWSNSGTKQVFSALNEAEIVHLKRQSFACPVCFQSLNNNSTCHLNRKSTNASCTLNNSHRMLVSRIVHWHRVSKRCEGLRLCLWALRVCPTRRLTATSSGIGTAIK